HGDRLVADAGGDRRDPLELGAAGRAGQEVQLGLLLVLGGQLPRPVGDERLPRHRVLTGWAEVGHGAALSFCTAGGANVTAAIPCNAAAAAGTWGERRSP